MTDWNKQGPRTAYEGQARPRVRPGRLNAFRVRHHNADFARRMKKVNPHAWFEGRRLARRLKWI